MSKFIRTAVLVVLGIVWLLPAFLLFMGVMWSLKGMSRSGAGATVTADNEDVP